MRIFPTATACSVLAFAVLAPPLVTGFVPLHVPTRAVSRVTMVKEKKETTHNDWITNWVADLQEWFETATHPDQAKKVETTASTEKAVVDDEWIAKELNELGATDISDLETVEEVQKEVVPLAKEVVTAEEVEQVLVVEPKATTKDAPPKPKPKVQKTTYEWLTRDMLKAGKAEGESKDWVATDMESAGKVGLIGDWVADDMKKAGEAGVDHTPTLKKGSQKVKTPTDRIAEGMTKVGRTSGVGWIEQDMNEAGKAREARTTTGADKLRDLLDTEHEKRYDDIYKDIEKVGKEGAHSRDWVEDDMVNAGKGESIMDKLNAATKDVTYKFEKWQKKRYETDKIREHMESAGQAEARDWVGQDIQNTGRNKTLVGRKYPAPKKDLREWLSQDESASIASDMEAEGRASGNRRTRKEKISRNKLADLVAADMEMVGRTSTDWVERDMERAGHAEAYLNKESTTMSHRQRETEEFMKTRKPKVSPVQKEEAVLPAEELVVPVIEEKEVTKPVTILDASSDVKPVLEEPHADLPHSEHHDFKHNIMRASKKVIMPWKKWKDL